MNDTPRTDAASATTAPWRQVPVCGSFARQLERELAEKDKEIERLKNWHQFVKGLVEDACFQIELKSKPK